MKLKKRAKIGFVYITTKSIKMIKKVINLLFVLIIVLCFVALYNILDRDISKYILLLFMQPVLLFFAYKQTNKVSILVLSLTAILCAFFTFGLNLLYAITFTIFVVTVLVLHSFFKPREIIESPKIQKKNNELKFFKEELLNEEKYLKREKETLEKNLEKIINFYMISKDFIQNFDDSESAANALLSILEKQPGVITVVVTAKEKISQNKKELKILSRLNEEVKEKWKKKIKNNIEIENLTHSAVVNSLFSINNNPVVAWPIIINDTLSACTFLEVENEYTQKYIEQGNLYIPHLHLGTERLLLFFEIKEKSIIDNYEKQLKLKDESIEFYKDFKARQSTKMIGESLEQHCMIEFNNIRMAAFPKAYFEKDNDAKTGSKGDFIFRESTDDGVEFISIMFEMKNEMDETATKHKNEDFFKELDKDRKEKNCEYAVLVSLLESDNDYYNNGIVDVSYRYEKMYVIRPQFFIPLITLLRNAALNSVSYRQELQVLKNQQVDLTNFEANLLAFKDNFAKNYDRASQRFNSAIEGIEKAINVLNKIRDDLLASENQLRLANGKIDDITIKKLTKNAPSIKAQIDEIRKNAETNGSEMVSLE